jgi:hypothetical protein
MAVTEGQYAATAPTSFVEVIIKRDPNDATGLIYETAAGGDAYTTQAAGGTWVRFSSDVGNFSISFNGSTPFDVLKSGKKKGDYLYLKVRKNTTPGTYKYSVAVSLPNDDPPLIDDPQMLIG